MPLLMYVLGDLYSESGLPRAKISEDAGQEGQMFKDIYQTPLVAEDPRVYDTWTLYLDSMLLMGLTRDMHSLGQGGECLHQDTGMYFWSKGLGHLNPNLTKAEGVQFPMKKWKGESGESQRMSMFH